MKQSIKNSADMEKFARFEHGLTFYTMFVEAVF